MYSISSRTIDRTKKKYLAGTFYRQQLGRICKEYGEYTNNNNQAIETDE
jgi:hypothetical protein